MKAPYKAETKAGLPVLLVPSAREAGMLEGSLKNYIAETWRKTMQRDDIYKHHISLKRDAIWSRIERLLNSPLTTVTLALWPETAAAGELFVVGWMVTSPGALHFVYVRERYRDAGVARSLLDAQAATGLVCATHWSDKLPNTGKVQAGNCEFIYAGVDWVPQHSPQVEYVDER